MNRRLFLALTVAPAFLQILTPFTTFAQDLEFQRALETAQKRRPATLSTTVRIAPGNEPGDPLVIHGRLVGTDGRTPFANAIVFAYHTDRTGLYAPDGSAAQTWRLRGWARRAADGRFEFQTVRPGAYPSRNQAAHVHFTVYTNEGAFHGGALEFDDDPLIGADDRARANASGQFGTIRKVRREGNVQRRLRYPAEPAAAVPGRLTVRGESLAAFRRGMHPRRTPPTLR
jgi:protocatechuate 3,4-dioxygenase beta subunit